MPHDKAQLNAAIELKNRKWLYCNDSMRWLKSNNQAAPSTAAPSKKDQKAGGKKGNNYQKSNNKDKSQESVANSRTVIVFNPLLWKEEIVNLIED